MKRVERVIAWVNGLFPVRVFNHFGERNGSVLAAGMSYQALFAVFAGVYVGFSVAGVWLLGQPRAMDSLLGILNTTIPGLIGEDGVIHPEDLATATTATAGFLTWTGALALVGLVLTATGWISSARLSLRLVFGLREEKRNFALLIALDLLVALGLGAMLVIASVLSVASTAALDWTFAQLGIAREGLGYTLLGRGVGLLIVLAINTLVLVLMFRFLTSAAIRPRRLLGGALLGGAALLALQLGSSLLVGGASRNPLLAAFAVLIGLLLFFNLTNTVILLAASWVAVGAADHDESLVRASKEELERRRVAADYEDELAAAVARVMGARRAHAQAGLVGRLRSGRRLRRSEHELAHLVIADAVRRRASHSPGL